MIIEACARKDIAVGRNIHEPAVLPVNGQFFDGFEALQTPDDNHPVGMAGNHDVLGFKFLALFTEVYIFHEVFELVVEGARRKRNGARIGIFGGVDGLDHFVFGNFPNFDEFILRAAANEVAFVKNLNLTNDVLMQFDDAGLLLQRHAEDS